MSQRHLRLDLNLFRVLDAIYTHGGISGAARALHLTQPAITHSLNKLRELLNDPLFVRQGNRTVPTEKARAILPKVQQCLAGLQEAVLDDEAFDLGQAELTFTVGFRDVLESIVLPLLMERLRAVAPQVKVISRAVLRSEIGKELSAGNIDLVVDRRLHVDPRIHSTRLHDETLVVVLGRQHPLAGETLQRQHYLDAHHVAVARQGGNQTLDTLLHEAGHARTISLVCQHYFAACKVVAGSDLMLTMPSHYAHDLTRVLPVVVKPLPIRIKPIQLEMYWHHTKENHRAHRWFRELIASIAAGAAAPEEDAWDNSI